MEKMSSKNLRAAMISACIGVNRLAQLADVQPATVSKFLKTDLPIRLPTLGKISKALGVNAKDLILKE